MNETEIRSAFNAATADLAAVRSRRATLEAELDSLAAQETAAQERAASLRAALHRFEVRPQDVERLGQLTATLSAKLAKLPDRSPTGARVKVSLEYLADETKPVSDRLNLCRSLLRDVSDAYTLDRATWDKAEGANAARSR